MQPTQEELILIKQNKIADKIKNHLDNLKKVEQFNLWLRSVAEKYFKIKIIDFDKNEVLWDKYEIKDDHVYYSTRRLSANSFSFPIKYLYHPELMNELKQRTKELKEQNKIREANKEKEKARNIIARYPELLKEYTV